MPCVRDKLSDRRTPQLRFVIFTMWKSRSTYLGRKGLGLYNFLYIVALLIPVPNKGFV